LADTRLKGLDAVEHMMGGTMNGDPLLQMFVEFAESGLEFSVTLSVGGMLISGTLTSHSEYLKLVSEHMQAITTPELRDLLTNGLANLVASAQTAVRERRQAEEIADALGEEPGEDVRPEYIHLKDAKVFLAADMGIPTQGGVLWRGKLASVDGFILGAATPLR
jgi:hypothetical protein